MTVAEAALVLGRNRKTVIRWIKSGHLPATRLPGETGAYLLDPADVERLVAS